MAETLTEQPTKDADAFWNEPLEGYETPEAPAVETPATETPEPEIVEPTSPEAETPAAAADPQLPEGYSKDARGRVHRADGTLASKEEIASFAVTPASAEPAAPAKVASPFQYRAFGETKAVEGATVNDDGSVTVAADRVPDLRHLYSLQETFTQQSGYVDQLKAKVQDLTAQVEQRSKSTSEESEKAKALVASYAQMLSEPDEAKAVEAFFRLRENFPVLLAEAKARFYQNQLTQGKPVASATQEPERAPEASQGLPQRESAIAATQDNIERIRLDHKYRDITVADWKQFADRASRTPYAYIVPATPEHAKAHDVKVGQPVFDTDALAADVEEFVGQTRKARTTADARAKLAAENARKTMPSIEAPPTAASVTRPPAKTPGKFASKQDVDDWFESDDLD